MMNGATNAEGWREPACYKHAAPLGPFHAFAGRAPAASRVRGTKAATRRAHSKGFAVPIEMSKLEAALLAPFSQAEDLWTRLEGYRHGSRQHFAGVQDYIHHLASARYL